MEISLKDYQELQAYRQLMEHATLIATDFWAGSEDSFLVEYKGPRLLQLYLGLENARVQN